jgi:hypothetical protein
MRKMTALNALLRDYDRAIYFGEIEQAIYDLIKGQI